MPQLEKTFQHNIDELSSKITHGVCSICPCTKKRGGWETTMGDVRCVVLLFEKYAPKIYIGKERAMPPYPQTIYRAYSDGDEYKDQAHYSLTVTLVGNNQEVRLFAITAGSGNETYFYPYAGAEGELIDALSTTLNILDNMIL